MTHAPIPFAKGHGTGNDFVILPDLDGALHVTAPLVAALCDRRRGVGADGVLVVARTSAHPEVADQAGAAPYFMDYRNADGSVAQMCGNGARVFVAHLLEERLVGPGRFQIATRGGARQVEISAEGEISIDMGPAVFLDRADLRARPAEASADEARPAVGVLMPNPHAVVWVQDVAEAGPLREAPVVTPGEAFPEGVNVEFAQVVDADRLRMRVFERGVGETLSCGTGACAVAVAAIHAMGVPPTGQQVQVDVPGGTLRVTWRDETSVVLAGPAVIVARGSIDGHWWSAHV